MITKASLAAIAALVLASGTNAFADATIHDANTGLNSQLFHDTIPELQRQGLPLPDAVVKKYGTPAPTAHVAPPHQVAHKAAPTQSANSNLQKTSMTHGGRKSPATSVQ